MSNYKEVRECRLCQSSNLQLVLRLGLQKVADFVASPNDVTKPSAPLELVLCSHCKLVQLRHSVSADVLYSNFWYKSAVTDSMKKALQDIVDSAKAHTNLRPDDAVLDIGANDGLLCSLYPKGVMTCGVDPCQQIMTEQALHRMTYAVRSYFNRQVGEALAGKVSKPFKVITAIAMFYDLEDPISFLRDVKSVLDDNGVFIIQMNYLATMLKNNCFDNICHEHLTYYSFRTLEWALSKVGFAVVDAEVNQINGGSLRVVCRKAPARGEEYPEGAVDRIREIMEVEQKMKLDNASTYLQFGKQVKHLLEKLSLYIVQQTMKGKRCYAYGASTRGSTLLQSVPIPLSGVAERDPAKIGRYMTASWLKIDSEEYVRSRANIMLVLPWHFRDEIVAREKEWLDNGGELVFPLPQPVSVTKDGEKPVVPEPLKRTRKVASSVMVGHA